MKYISNNEAETMNLANKLAKQLNIGDIVVLSGELGSGKTKFVEGFLTNFNLQSEISSPTFNIVNEYKNDDITIYHFDVYRLADSSEFYEIGGEEFFETGICLIEWGEIINDILPKDYIKINFEQDLNVENRRILNIHGYGEKYLEVLKNLTNI